MNVEKSFVSKIDVFDQTNLWGYHLQVDPAIAEAFKAAGIKRVVCTVNEKLTLHAAILSSQGYYYILLNKQNVKKLQATSGDEVHIHLKEETAKYGMPMCEEMKEVLNQDHVALDFFDGLTPGKQRNLIHLVGKVKNSGSRINKSLAIAEHLVESKGKIDFKRLNELIKQYNQRNLGI